MNQLLGYSLKVIFSAKLLLMNQLVPFAIKKIHCMVIVTEGSNTLDGPYLMAVVNREQTNTTTNPPGRGADYT